MDDTSTTISSVKVATKFRLPGIAFCVAESEQPALLFFGCSDFSVYRVDSKAEKPEPAAVSESKHDSYVTGLARSGTNLISGSYDGSLIWWNADSGQVVHHVKDAHSKWIRRIAVSPDGKTLASVADDMQTRLWNAETGEAIATWGDYELKTPHGYPSMLYTVTFSPNGEMLATGDRTGKVIVRNASSGEITATLETPVMYTWDPKARRHSIGGIRSLAFSNGSNLLAVGGMGKVGNIDHLDGASRIEIFDWKSGERKLEIEDTKYKGLVEQIQFGPGDSWLAAAGGANDGFVSVYSVADGKLLAQEKAPMHIHDFQLSKDGTTLRAVGYEQACVFEIA